MQVAFTFSLYLCVIPAVCIKKESNAAAADMKRLSLYRQIYFTDQRLKAFRLEI